MHTNNDNQPAERWQMIHGEALATLPGLPADHFDAVICDPPYSSGGFSRDDKCANTADKYGIDKYPVFGGDSRDQRSYLAWCTLWIDAALRTLKTGGYFLAFTDWRQLPVMSDAVQCGGVFMRGVVAWDKGPAARAPHKGYFRHQWFQLTRPY